MPLDNASNALRIAKRSIISVLDIAAGVGCNGCAIPYGIKEIFGFRLPEAAAISTTSRLSPVQIGFHADAINS